MCFLLMVSCTRVICESGVILTVQMCSVLRKFSLSLVKAPLSYINIVKNRKKSVNILHDMSGIIRPNRYDENKVTS